MLKRNAFQPFSLDQLMAFANMQRLTDSTFRMILTKLLPLEVCGWATVRAAVFENSKDLFINDGTWSFNMYSPTKAIKTQADVDTWFTQNLTKLEAGLDVEIVAAMVSTGIFKAKSYP